MAIASFKKDDLIGLIDDDCDTLERIKDCVTGKTRWSINHSLVFKDKASGKFYEAAYGVGATEQQDEGPFEHAPDLVECWEVRAVEKVVIAYERAP